MTKNKAQATEAGVATFLNAADHPTRPAALMRWRWISCFVR